MLQNFEEFFYTLPIPIDSGTNDCMDIAIKISKGLTGWKIYVLIFSEYSLLIIPAYIQQYRIVFQMIEILQGRHP